MKTSVIFNVYEHIQAKAFFVNGLLVDVKLITKVPRGYYNHFLNDAGLEAERLFN